jgi:D-3-phosphoglycerate dehydrogenase
VNCARGGIIDEQALLDAVEAGTIAGAAIDVFTKEPPAPDNPALQSDRIIVTPHLGASTEEAQVNVAVDIAEQIVSVLNGGQARYAVNLPLVAPEALRELTPFMGVTVALGELAIQMVEGQLGTVTVEYSGDIAAFDTSILTGSLIKGLIEPISDVPINLVNARSAAEQRGLTIVEKKGTPSEAYNSLITVRMQTSAGEFSAAGTVFSNRAHIVSIEGYRVDIVPEGNYWLLSKNLDKPGMVGMIGTLLGKSDININTMQTGRERPRGEVLMVLGVDEPIPDAVVEEIKAIGDIHTAKLVKL